MQKKKLVCYPEGQGHWEGLYNQNATISIIPSKLLIHLQPSLASWYIFISQSVKNWIAVFKVKVTAKLQNVNVCLDEIFWTPELFITKIDMVMQHYEPEYHMEKIVCYLHGQGHSEWSKYDCF